MASAVTPCIASVLDTDAYKLHMQQAVFHRYPDTVVTAEFCCRNADDLLGEFAQEIQEQVRLMGTLRLTAEEYAYLETLPFFKEDYLHYLRDEFRFKPEQVAIRSVPTQYAGPARAPTAGAATPSGVAEASMPNTCAAGGDSTPAGTVEVWGAQLQIVICGPWVEVIMWEVPLLAIISEVVHRRRTPHVGVPHALATLRGSMDGLWGMFHSSVSGDPTRERTCRNPLMDRFRFSDFGTRRRFSRAVHEAVVQELKTNPMVAASFAGTSNYDLARRYRLRPIGTQAHEWFQAFQALSGSLQESQTCALRAWMAEYPNADTASGAAVPNPMGIVLTDCIGMDAFLRDFTPQFAQHFTGLRQDSGDPFEWGRKAIRHYQSLGIDPKNKTLVFSDSLNFIKAVQLFHTFHTSTNVLFGIGTFLTCTIRCAPQEHGGGANLGAHTTDDPPQPSVRPLNIVIKLTSCNGKPVAKISDSPGKSLCSDAAYVEQLKRAFDVPSVA